MGLFLLLLFIIQIFFTFANKNHELEMQQLQFLREFKLNLAANNWEFSEESVQLMLDDLCSKFSLFEDEIGESKSFKQLGQEIIKNCANHGSPFGKGKNSKEKIQKLGEKFMDEYGNEKDFLASEKVENIILDNEKISILHEGRQILGPLVQKLPKGNWLQNLIEKFIEEVVNAENDNMLSKLQEISSKFIEKTWPSLKCQYGKSMHHGSAHCKAQENFSSSNSFMRSSPIGVHRRRRKRQDPIAALLTLASIVFGAYILIGIAVTLAALAPVLGLVFLIFAAFAAINRR